MFLQNKIVTTKPKNAKNQVYDVDSVSALTNLHLPTLISTKNIKSATCTIDGKGKYVITIVMGKGDSKRRLCNRYPEAPPRCFKKEL